MKSDIGEVINEFAAFIPEHINNMPALSSNGVSRNEMEWKAISIAMGKEIIKLRKIDDNRK